MAIIRTKRTKNFTVLNNDLIRDSRLSFKARGLLQYMLSMPDDWKFYVSELAKHSCKEGESAINTGLEELEELGYMRRIQRRESNGKFGAVDWEVFDEPAFSPEVENPLAEKPTAGKPLADNRQLLNTNELSTNKLNTNSTKDNRSSDKSSDRVSEKQLEEDFDKLWKLYPRKEGKKKAYEAYKRAIKKGVTNKEIQAGIVNYLKQIKIQGTDKKYIKQGSTWFNGNCWDDEYSVGINNSPVNQKQSTAYSATDERKDRAEGFMRNLREHPEWFTQDHIKAFLKDFPEMKEEVLKIERTRRKSDSDTAQ